MRKRLHIKTAVLLWLITALTITTTSLLPSKVSAAPDTTMAVLNPNTGDGNFTFYTNTTSIGHTFAANVSVFDVTDCTGWQLNLTFDPTKLQIVSFALPSDHIFAGNSIFQGTPDINNVAGYVLQWVANGIGQPAFTGSGRLCQITFNITTAPGPGATLSSPLHIVVVGETTFYSKLEDSIPFNATDGQYRYISSEEVTPAYLYVDPDRIVDSALTPCNNFTVDINIQDVIDLYSFQFTVGFNSTLLNVVSAELGSFFPLSVTPIIVINNTAGTVQFSASLTPPETPRTGNGTLATIIFHVEELGACNLTLTDTILQNQLGDPILHETGDGYFNNMLIAKLAVDPPEIIDPSLVPPKTFEINITLDDVENVYAYEFKLGYDPDLLAVIGVIFLDALNETYYTPQFTVNNTLGIVWVNVTYYPPSSPLQTTEPVALLTLIFRVKGMGGTPLDLHDTNLCDDLGNPISHEVYDGFFLAIIKDVAVIDVVPSRTQAYVGWLVYINVTVRNEGNVSETFDVKAYYDSNVIGTLTVNNLAPNAETTITFVWDTTGVTPCHNYTIKAEALPVPYEIDLADNTFVDGGVKIKLLGDINGDGIVDVSDINLTILAFGSIPGHPRWNPDADLNLDNKVDITDVSICIANYGKAC